MFYLPESPSNMSMMPVQQMSLRLLRTKRETDYGEREGNEDFENVCRERALHNS
jgi:hypothetical protein